MFVGHYGPAFVAKRLELSIPLWVLFVAVQFLDVLWAPFVLLGIEKVRIVPHFTGSNALDLYYMPYTHGLLSAIVWSIVLGVLYQSLARPARRRASLVVGAAVFSHWLLDLLVHVPDLPLVGNSAKIGFGLWNAPVLAFALEIAVLAAGLWLYLATRPRRSVGIVAYGLVLTGIQAWSTFLSPPPASDRAQAATALVAYGVLAWAVWWLADRPTSKAGAA